ncbi:MAG: hypothetical protein AMJ84_06515 [Acidithiobacillales bacterium SM23_46]|nr:MAG: hypothetical protein AMJ84_06515 [Acidithiobacillales bacterium SM23_46]
MARRRQAFPIAGLAEAFGELRSDYNMAQTGRFRKRLTGVSSAGSGADYHYRSQADYLRIMELSRSFDRNDLVVGQGINRTVNNVVQDGFRHRAKTGDAGLDKELHERWEAWSTNPAQCHKGKEFDLHDLAWFSLRHSLVDGDIFVFPDRDGSLELVEAHRVRTPSNTTRNVVHGILLDEHRQHKEVWVTKEDLSPLQAVARVRDITPFPVRDADGNRLIQQVYQPKRISQTRGISVCAPIVDAVGMHDDIQFAKLVQQQVVSCFAVLRETPLGHLGGSLGQYGEEEEQSLSDGTTRTLEGIAPGLEVTGRPGEKLIGFSPQVPNPEFKPHALLILTFIAINLDLPLAVLLLDPTMTNFSGWRGALDQAKFGFRRQQRLTANRFYTPIYEFQVRHWAATDSALRRRLTQDPARVLVHEFNPPVWPYIQPVDDSMAATIQMRTGQTSLRRFHASRGSDWDLISTEQVEDSALAIRKAKLAAQEINAEFDDGAPVHWRELINLPTPDTMPVRLPEPFMEDSRNERNGSDDRFASAGLRVGA